MAQTTADLDLILMQWRAGDAAAKDRLFERVARRFAAQASQMLRPEDRVRRWVDSGDLLAEMQIRLLKAIQNEIPDSGEMFLKLASAHMSWALLDFARRFFGPEGLGTQHQSDQPVAGSRQSGVSLVDRLIDESTPSAMAQANESRLMLLEAIDALPEKQAEAIRLCFLMGETVRDAARILETSESAVSKRLKLAKIKLGRLLRNLP